MPLGVLLQNEMKWHCEWEALEVSLDYLVIIAAILPRLETVVPLWKLARSVPP